MILFTNYAGGNWTNVAEYLGTGVNFFNYSCSARSILSLSYLMSCYYLIKKKIVFSGIFILIGMLSHPTNGFIISLTIIGFLIFNFFEDLGFKKNSLKKMIFFIAIGIIPIIIKLVTIGSTLIDFQIEEVPSLEYINSMYRDEIDDFSALYLIFSSKIVLISSLLFSILPLIISYFLRKKIKEKIKIISYINYNSAHYFFISSFY